MLDVVSITISNTAHKSVCILGINDLDRWTDVNCDDFYVYFNVTISLSNFLRILFYSISFGLFISDIRRRERERERREREERRESEREKEKRDR
jgi:hypothetical protein